MTRVYVIRHAEAEGNLYRRIQGQYDGKVTAQGKKQIALLKKRFEGTHIDAVYSSDMTRTMETAAAIYAPKGLTLNTTPMLREIHMGVWEDKNWGEAEYKEPRQMINFHRYPEQWDVEGGEPFVHLRNRIVGIVKELAAENDGKTIALFTHGTAIRNLICAVRGLPLSEISEISYCDNTAVALLNVADGEIEAEFYNDSSHLTPETSLFMRQTWWKKTDGKDGSNLRFEVMDLEKSGEKHMEYSRKAWRTIYGMELDNAEDYLEMAKGYASRHPRAVLEVYYGNEPAGMLEMDVEKGREDGAGHIAFCYLEEQCRNRSLGVQLIGEAISMYRGLGRDKLRLHVAGLNIGAIGFYEKYGFIKTGETEGAGGNLFVMEKEI